MGKKIMKKLLKSDQGNISIMAAFSLPALILMGGLAVDYGIVVKERQQLKAIVDAAATAGVNEGYLAAVGLETIDIQKEIKAAATAAFNAQIGQLSGSLHDIEFDADAQIVNNRMVLSVKASGTYDTNIMSFGGVNTLDVTTDSTASVALAQYANITLLFDISSSMGIGATQADREEMATHLNCAFGCHMRQNWYVKNNRGDIDAIGPWAQDRLIKDDANYLQKARDFGFEQNSDGHYIIPSTYTNQDLADFLDAKSRMDVSKEGAIAGIKSLQDVELGDDQVSITVTTFSNELDIILPHDDPNALDHDNVVDNIANGVKLHRERGGTNAAHSIKQLVDELPEGGSGFSPDDRAQYVVILTDGIMNRSGRRGYENDYWSSPSYPRKGLHLFNAISCEWMAEKNIKPIFLLTNYVADYTEGRGTGDSRNVFINNNKSIIRDRAESCVQNPSDHVISADSPEQIEAAFKKIFGILSAPLRLTGS